MVSCDENETEVQESEITVKILDVEQTLKVKFCIPVTSVKLDKNLIILGKNSETSTFTATVYPENASDKTVTWECSDTDVISLENGTITTKAAGVATITAKAGEKQATASILVLNTSDSFTYDRSTLHQLTAEEALGLFEADVAERPSALTENFEVAYQLTGKQSKGAYFAAHTWDDANNMVALMAQMCKLPLRLPTEAESTPFISASC